MFALLAFGSAAFMISPKFKYNQPITTIDKINSSFVNTPPNINNKYNWQKSNPNVYGNLVAYAAPVHSRVKPIVKRSRTPIMIIDEGLSPFRNTFDYLAWACVIISIFIRPRPPPPPPMTPILVEKNLAEKNLVVRLGGLGLLCGSAVTLAVVYVILLIV